MSGKKARIVIVGGGFAGVYTAMELERQLRDGQDFEIVLVSDENYFVFQPMLPEVISGTIGLTDVVSPLRRLLPKTDVHVRAIEKIDLERRAISLAPGFLPHAHVIEFDHLVLALGTVTDFRGMRGLPEHAFPFKDLQDALRLRQHLIHALEEAAIERDDMELRQQLLTFVVAGGGFSGVEVVAELNDFVRSVARNYRGLDPAEIRVVLLHAQDRILPEMEQKLALFAQKILSQRGVELRLGTLLEAATGSEAVLKGGERIPTRTLVSTVPSSPNPQMDLLKLPKTRGRVETDGYLRVIGSNNLWAAGDCALVKNPDGSACPPTAQHAIRQGTRLARNLVASLRGGRQQPFDFKGLGKMGSLGHRSAVAEILGVNVSGFLAWWIWRTIYLMKLPGWGRRLKVAVAWTLDLLLPPELVQLRLRTAPTLAREHFEPGQEVFHEGDLGDRVYIVQSGSAEVVRQRKDGGEERLAVLRAGECFGEMAVLGRTARSATIRCLEPMDALALSQRDFRALADNVPEMRKGFEAVAQRRSDAGRVAAAR